LNIISRLKSLVKLVTFGLAIATTGNLVTSSKANAEITYPLVNGQVVRFYLDNGQGINITTSAGLVNNGWVNSFTGSNTDPEQQFRVVSDGSYYLFVRNGTNFALSSSTLTPTNGSPVVSYTAGNGAWQNLLLDRIDASHYLIKWQSNQNYCVHIPNGARDVQLKLTTCNASDTTQRFNIYTTGGLPNYVSPYSDGATGTLESDSGQRIKMLSSTNNGGIAAANPNNSDPNQFFRMIKNENLYNIQIASGGFSLSSTTLNPSATSAEPLISYQSGFGRWQGFGFVDVGNGRYNIKWAFNPSLCVSAMAGSSGNYIPVTLSGCNNSANQKWRLTNIPNYTQVTEYEFWIIARQTGNGLLINWNGGTDVGHVTTAVIPVTKYYNNGVLYSTQYSTDKNQITTYSYWPDSSTPQLPSQCSRQDCSLDKTLVVDVLSKGTITGISDNGAKFAIRRLRLAPSSVATLNLKAYSATNCTGYANCTCVDEAARLWSYSTGENAFLPSYNSLTKVSPNFVYNKIMNANTAINSSGYAINGQYTIIQ
jgi:hypothetical protein